MSTHSQPNLTFFCELDVSVLKDLFSDIRVIEQLRELRASISLGLIDLLPERAEIVRQLNQAGIPVDAWLLLPKDQGYWFNLDNAPQAVSMYQEFKAWTAEYGLRWNKIGLDIEPDIRLFRSFKDYLWMGIPALINRLWLSNGRSHARDVFKALVATIRQDGYQVESYQMPLIADERKVQSRFIENMSGIFDIQVDREVLMLYSTFSRPRGDSLLWSYGPAAGGIGLGVTGGGVDAENMVDSTSMSWDELERDLLIAAHWSDNIYIFSLEGCVAQGFLEKIISLDWSKPPVVSAAGVKKVNLGRSIIQALLWLTTQPWLIVGLVVAPFILFRRRKRG